MPRTTTTIDPFFYDPFDFDPFDYDPDNYDLDNYDLDNYDPDNYDLSEYYENYLDKEIEDIYNSDYTAPIDTDWESLATVRNAVTTFKYVVAIVGIVMNVLHFFILTRRGLRNNFVFIIMIGICICDILIFFHSARIFLLEKKFEYSLGDCIGGKPYRFMLISLITMALESIGRKCSVLLALIMAAFRTCSIMFPMSDSLQDLSTVRSGILIIVFVSTLSTVWESARFMQFEIVPLTNCKPVPADHIYILEGTGTFSRFFVFDGYFMIVTALLYVIAMIALIVELRKTRRKHMHSKSETSDGTTQFIIMMSLSFFLSGFCYGITVIPYDYFAVKYNYMTVLFSFIMEIPEAMLILNSLAHCFICVFMSSQYRTTLRKVFRRKNKIRVHVVEPATVVGRSTSMASRNRSDIIKHE